MKKKAGLSPLNFYTYALLQSTHQSQGLECGIRLDVLESKIPFDDYLKYSWNQLKSLNISACNIDDELWQRFIQSSDKFQLLVEMDLSRNSITTLKKTDLEKFPRLKNVSIRRNNLTN